jgi:pyruvate,water dikinase
VRSSAPQEDSTNVSFAGIHTSCLNVQGVEAVEWTIRSVWLSLWTPAAIAYRKRIGLAHAEAAMAVLIMPLVPAIASGIGFTRDPISGRDDRLVIHAVHGLGESLVGG